MKLTKFNWYFYRPENYWEYVYWRSFHQHLAVSTMLGALAYALGRWF